MKNTEFQPEVKTDKNVPKPSHDLAKPTVTSHYHAHKLNLIPTEMGDPGHRQLRG
jgi:hypothetical protein